MRSLPLLLVLGLALKSSRAVVNEESCVGGSTYVSSTGSCFQAIEGPYNWDAAMAACASNAPSGLNGRLAVIPDEATESAIEPLTDPNPAWIGLKRTSGSAPGTIEDFTWIDGSPVGYSSPTLLNNVKFFNPQINDCMVMRFKQWDGQTERWHDWGCNVDKDWDKVTPISALCEYGEFDEPQSSTPAPGGCDGIEENLGYPADQAGVYDNTGYLDAGSGPVASGSELSCDFESSCCWSNSVPPEAQMEWLQSDVPPDSAVLSENMGTSEAPSGSYLVVGGADCPAGGGGGAPTVSCDGGAKVGDSCFMFIPGPMNWNEALAKCQDSAPSGTTGRLAQIPDADTESAVEPLAQPQSAWIGAHRFRGLAPGTVEDFSWTSDGVTEDAPVGYYPSLRLNNIKFFNPQINDCLLIRFNQGFGQEERWHDWGCNVNLDWDKKTEIGAMCEYVGGGDDNNGQQATSPSPGGAAEARFISCNVECADDVVTVSLKHWQSANALLQVCTQESFREDFQAPLLNCQEVPKDSSPGPYSVTLPPGEAFDIVIVASNVGNGGAVAIDDVTVDYPPCGVSTPAVSTPPPEVETTPPATPPPTTPPVSTSPPETTTAAVTTTAQTSPAATTAGGDECGNINCDFEDGICSYKEASETGGGENIPGEAVGFEQLEGQTGNYVTGILPRPDDAESPQYAGTYLRPGENAAMITEGVQLKEDRVVKFSYYEATKDMVLYACIDTVDNCPWDSSNDVTPDDRAWKDGYMTLPKETKSLIFYLDDQGTNQGGAGIDDIELLVMPDSGNPEDATEPVCPEGK
jgi:hypothetical protein